MRQCRIEGQRPPAFCFRRAVLHSGLLQQRRNKIRAGAIIKEHLI